MRLDYAILLCTLLTDASVNALAFANGDVAQLQTLKNTERDSKADDNDQTEWSDLWKRKGGGGGRGGGGSGGGGRGSSSSNSGGSTKTGSGPQPRFGGGVRYGGGSRSPYTSGGRSPGGIVPSLIVGTAIIGLTGLLIASFYLYEYRQHGPYTYWNATSARNETKALICGCEQYAVCGCDDDGDRSWLKEIIGDGAYSSLNRTLIQVVQKDGNGALFLNGTLPNGTTVPGGDEDAFSSAGGMHSLLHSIGWWPAAVTVGAMVFMS